MFQGVVGDTPRYNKGWSRAVRGESGGTATVDFTRAAPRMDAIGKQWAREVSATMVREMEKGVPRDTSYSASHIGLLSFDKGHGYHIGVLGLTGKRGESLAYLAMMNEGIKRHFVSFTNPDGSIREAFVNWARRHGFAVWKSYTGRAIKREAKGSRRLIELGMAKTVMAMRGLMVWGYSRPWATNAFRTTERIAHELMQSYHNALGKLQGSWSRYTKGSAAEDFEE